MKKIKFAATLILGFTIGEFVTSYRLQPQPMTIKSFTKEYFKLQGPGLKASYKAGASLWEDPKKGKADLTAIMFPARQ